MLAKDASLMPDQRAIAIRGLRRQQQAAEAGAAQEHIVDEARAAPIAAQHGEKHTMR